MRARYGPVDVLHEVALPGAEGGVTTLLGAHGAGETRLLRAIRSFARRSGSIRSRAG